MNTKYRHLLRLSTSLASLISVHSLPAQEEATMAETRKEASVAWQEKAVEYARIMSRVRWTPVADTMPNRRGGYF